MALRNQPYFPLYIQDFLTDEKLIECSAAATGVYIRLMCIMHKLEDYGRILLKQKDKQTGEQKKDFALKVAKQMPYDFDTVYAAITELLSEGVLYVDGDYLCQRRMILDNQLSVKRSESGRLGGKANINNIQEVKDFAYAKTQANDQAKVEANPEYENESNVLGSEKVKEIANRVWEDEAWKHTTCMGLSVTIDEFKKWLALFNSSIANDNVKDFGVPSYKKMCRGWISKQKAKGVTVETGVQKTSTAPTLTRL